MYEELQAKLGLEFENLALYERCFTHRSYVNESPEAGDLTKDNERLEFLGDAVLELVVTDYLFREYPDRDEGLLTAWRSALVEGKHLAAVADDLGLGEHLRLSKGEERSGGRAKSYILANTTEALIGAVYLDLGYVAAAGLINEFVLVNLPELLAAGADKDAKSGLQELSQDVHGLTPHYECVEESGPDHAKTFTMAAFVGDREVGRGSGSSKQKAAQEAAAAGLVMLESELNLAQEDVVDDEADQDTVN